MAPKLLTDCPENLREAIDWLVQVQHCGGVSTVSDALATLFDNVAQDAEKSLPSLPDPDRPSARDVVSKLRAFQSTLPKDSANSNKNIIHNLCASAGSLLGYRSPGTYDGSGIVYGNASRLCDAILAFLYAVFSDVCDNQPYVAGRYVLRDVIVELKSQLWRGRKGFCQAIPKVATGLQRYNSAVKGSNEKVKKPIETVLDYVKSDGELRRGINDLQITEASTPVEDQQTVESAVSLVEQCKEVAKVFSKSLTAATNAIDDLNLKGKRKLENARRSFFNHVDWLSRWSEKGQKGRLDNMIKKIKSRLKRLAKAVKEKIKQEVRAVVELLKERVSDIKMKLEGITASLEEYVEELGRWMDDAKKYINAVKEYVNEIMQQLDGKHRQAIDKAAADIDSVLSEKVGELTKWIETADAAVNVAKEKAANVYERLDKENSPKIGGGLKKIDDARNRVDSVNSELKTVHKDLKDWKNAAEDVLSNAAGKAGEVRDMLNPDKDGDDNRIGNNIKIIDAANREMANANKELEGKVESLRSLIQDAESIRAAAQRKAEDAYENLDVHKELSKNIQKIVDARKKISDARTGLKNVDKHLGEWNIEAERVLEGAVKKATEVFNMLNKNDAGNDISKGITHITTAKEKVSHVDRELQKVYGDLDMWIEAAKNVLAISLNKAGDVHKMLNPDELHGKYALGENIKELGQAKTELDSANKTLKIQVENLNKWIQDAETIRQEAEKKVKEAYDKLQVHEKLSRKFGEIITANQKIKDVNAGISSVDSKLGEWSKEARNVIQGVADKAKQIYEKLNIDDDKQPITQGISQINATKSNILKVDADLRKVNTDLRKWIVAAQNVLDIAIGNAETVHTTLNPAKGKSTLGDQIHSIDTARQGIVDANMELAGQVKSLNKWIQDAEDIRAAAEAKAREAYDKLDVHEKLSQNVKKIMEAKEKIEVVNKSVNTHLESLNQWNDKAKEVIDGAVEKAQHVHDALKDNVDKKMGEIEQENNAIKTACESLESEVNHLGNWKDAARKVIDKAKAKCDEILKRVDINHKDNEGGKNGPVIFKQAKELQDKGTKLLKAAQDAKRKVEEKVKSALEAVKNMDTDLKKDLKVVKDEIMKGIKDVIEKLKVDKLGEKVKQDLQKLRERIEGLKGSNKLVNDKVEMLIEEHDKVKQKTQETMSKMQQEMQKTFKEGIKDPLNQKVGDVEKAIEALYKTINPKDGVTQDDKNRFQPIFEHIKNDVTKIKGNGNQKGNESGLDGIVAKVKGLANAFHKNGNGFGERVDGWIGSILGINENQRKTQTGGMKAVTSWIGAYYGQVRDRENALKAVKEQIKKALGAQIKAGQEKISSRDVKDSVVENLTKVKEACEAFVDTLDKKLANTEIEPFVQQIVTKIQDPSVDQRLSNENDDRKTTVRAALIALCSCVRQVASEVQFIGINMFGKKIDTIKQTVDELNTNLTNATKPSESSDANPDHGTAQAVDNAIEGVKDMVDGIDRKFEVVKTPVEGAVKEIESEVDKFDTKAREQVKAAAKGAIDKAANVISEDAGTSEKDVARTMKNFHNAHQQITKNLKPKLEKLLSDHIGKDEVPYVGNPEKVKLSNDFEKYLDHVSIGVLTGHPHGPLAEAIDKIVGEGMQGLSIIHPRHIGNDRIDEHSFENPFKAIQSQLEEIAELVSDTRTDMTGEPASYRNGIKNYLEQLEKALGDGKLDEAEKGLDNIKKAIGQLQREPFSTKPAEIGKAVKEIKLQVDELRTKLLNDTDSRGVIDDLKDLKGKGLESGKWNLNVGMTQIHKELEEQNKILPRQTKVIGEAMDTVIKDINNVLREVGMTLDHHIIPDGDLIFRLKQIEDMIGRGKYKHEGTLQGIHDMISGLTARDFSVKPDKIGRSLKAIKARLKTLQGVLQGEKNKHDGVISALNDLKTDGLGPGEWNKKRNTKGLQAIENDLKIEESKLSWQPTLLNSGFESITNVLDELRKELKDEYGNPNNDVINKLEDLLSFGFNGAEWQRKNVGGFVKIKNDLQKQNAELPKETDKIKQAIDAIKEEIQNVLIRVGMKLNHTLMDDDVVDNLGALKLMISRGGRGGLQAIQKKINDLVTNAFRTNSEAIQGAKDTITEELKRLQTNLKGVKDNDVIETLKDLIDSGLGAGEWKKGRKTKGLETIKMELKKQQSELSSQPGLIDVGVDKITKVLEVARAALHDDKGNPKSDVIKRLEDLRENGLGDKANTWNGKNGLQKIRIDLKSHNEKLSEDGEEMEKAMDRVLMQIQGVLRNARMKLGHHIIPHDDIAWDLNQLQRIFGLGKIKDHNNLQNIRNDIEELQSKIFTEKHEAIGKAKEHIANELRRLKNELDTNISSTLTDLIGNGMGKDKTWQNDNKGLGFINGELERQQGILKKQPEDIEAGVLVVTHELDELRNVLDGRDSSTAQERGVMRNLEFLMKYIGDSDDVGLKQIRKALETLNTKTVPVVTDNLRKLCGDIQHAAAYADWNLGQLENPHIDGKLKGIQDGLTNLRLTDLAEAITMCDNVLKVADEIEKNTVKALLKHVDDQVDDAIEDLTKEARELYVDSLRDALKLFARKVNEDLVDLPSDIDYDLTIGFKGFMDVVEGENGVNINKLKCVESRELKQLCAAFASFFGTVNEYVCEETERLHDEQNRERNPSLPPTGEPYTPKLNDVYEALTAVLGYLRDHDGDADRLTELVERLTTALRNMVPSDFKRPSTPLLDTVFSGIIKFAGEFHNTYISAYSGQRCREEHAHKYAKVLLSMIPMTYKALHKLAVKCEGEWKHLPISMFTADDRDNALGNYLTRCGYRVASAESGQDGELNNVFTGGGIYELLTTPIDGVDIKMHQDSEQVRNGINLVHIIDNLHTILCHYFQACHIAVPLNPRYPCTVRDMLSWLSGLQYTQVADKLPEHCKALLNCRCHDGDTPNKHDPIMAKCIESLPLTIARTCSYSTALLTAIQGNGHGFDLAAYPYSVDFSNNRAKLHYPDDPDALLDMLRGIVCRLCRVLYFLYSQCCRSTTRVKGWRECSYGRQVPSHHWQCGEFGTQSAVSAITTTAATTITSTTIHGCPSTSPLQSFLSDRCQGLLPHTLTAADMTIKCANCSADQPGQQCLTPLGFWDLGFSASVCGTGWDLAKRLGDICRDADSCLFVLCRTLSYLCSAAPSSLADMFALYAQVLRKWDPNDHVKHRGGTYTDASDLISHLNTDGIDSLFPLWTVLHGNYENRKLTSAIASLAGHDHKSHDALSSLFNESTCKSPSGCAPYLQPLGLHARHTYPRKHAGLYITWIMYLAWQFWELLSDLLQALDNIDCTASGCATCPCQPGTHGGKSTCHCPSLVQCAGPLPTLHRYGFTYRNANLLVTDNYAMRCSDLNAQLKQVLHSEHFTELFHQIDQLIWHIRMPFLYFLIALWSLVALYILHTFLYRMDVLYIRSHLLTTNASHLIDVKALLIPSRKMLSLYDASYFDDDPAELLEAT